MDGGKVEAAEEKRKGEMRGEVGGRVRGKKRAPISKVHHLLARLDLLISIIG